MNQISKVQKPLFLKCKDHTVSGESFALHYNEEYDLLETHPVPEDLSQYYKSESYISHTDSKRTLFEKVYHFVKGIALNRKRQLIEYLNKGPGTLLDIGAGTGDFLYTCQRKGWKITGVEPNAEARKRSEEKGVPLYGSAKAIKNQTFDVITLWHVLEHVPDVKKQIRELKKLLAVNGTLVVAVPNFKSYDASHYKEFWAAYDVPRHIWHFSKRSLHCIFEEEKMKVIQTLPMKFDAFYVSLLSEKYKTGKMDLFSAISIGLKSNWHARSSGEYSSLIYIIKNQ
ncbi:class I SAM-dependent methyltransferase [Ascidiimonas aurantiaca]|uniref:class I SAM-dependent methyltransferase n=1 Tax=Ascidiimonas aurantiaca TaxID=1685432 RepID=UPI0030EE78BC